MPEKVRKAIEHIGGKVERLADFAHRAAAAVGDHICRHRRSVRAVASIHFLDDALAPVAAREIEIDVRPRGAAFAEEALKQKIARDRVAGRDAERVAHDAVCRRAAALHEDAVLGAEVHDVPDDEKVSGES